MPAQDPTYITSCVTIGTLIKNADELEYRVSAVGSLEFIGPIRDLSERLQDECNAMDRKGYEVVSVIPITSGLFSEKWNYSFGIGVTGGVIITGKRRG